MNSLKTLFLILLSSLSFSKLIAQEVSLFPTFDKIVHYSFPVSDSMLSAYYHNPKDNSNAIKNAEYLLRSLPIKGEIDQKLPKKLKQNGFSAKSIPDSIMTKIDSIFVQRPTPETMYLLQCRPVYRDYLIFKNKNRIVAIAQLCFSCEQHNLLGTVVSQSGFGYYNELKRIQKILYPEAE